MKKESFLKGALISTMCIVFSKILGIIYVIPFHNRIGEKGGALYSYAYTIYNLFLTLSTVGLPLAISKIVSEYNTLDYQDAKKRAYRISYYFTVVMSIIFSLTLFIFAPQITTLIKGGIVGGNTQEDIVFVLRISSTAIFFATMLSSIRGYLQGHSYISVSSYSQVIEQFIRVTIIIIGGYLGMKYFGLKEAVGIAISGATIGAIVALIYLKIKMNKNKYNKNYIIKKEEAKITNKYLLKKLIKYAIPFVIASIVGSLYATVDTFTIVKGLVNYGNMTPDNAEAVLGIIATWGGKLNMIVTSIASGIVISVLPNLTSDYVSNNIDNIKAKVTKTLELLLYFVIPMAVGLSSLSIPIWKIFYGNSTLGPEVFKYSIYMSIFSSLFININVIMQSLNRYKKVYISLFSGIIFKTIFNIPMIIIFNKLKIPPYYAPITATILGYLISIIISLKDLKKNFQINYSQLIKKIVICTSSILIVAILIFIMNLIFPFKNTNVISSMIIVSITALMGSIIYFYITYKTNVFQSIFDKNITKKIPILKLKQKK